jgi:hypothetical protein
MLFTSLVKDVLASSTIATTTSDIFATHFIGLDCLQVIRNGDDEPLIDMPEDIGMRIIEKCDCLPLAIKVMGGLLCKKMARRGDWEKVLNDAIWSVSRMPEELNYAIYLSYEDLHSSLKQCFLHYSLIPNKSTRFFVDDIVNMWISEGFVEGNSDELEELAMEYYNELILRNLIEPDLLYVFVGAKMWMHRETLSATV